MSIQEQTYVYPGDFVTLANASDSDIGSVKLVKYRRNNKIYVLNILNKSINEKEIKVFYFLILLRLLLN